MPGPKPQSITLTENQQTVLEKIARRQSSSQQLVRRVQIILHAAQAKNNQQVAQELGIHRETVRQWRKRWIAATERFKSAESSSNDLHYLALMESVLADDLRPGSPSNFSLEQIVEIIAIACEPLTASERPLSHWTPKALAQEAVKRSIVKEISPRSVGRFLKRGSSTTAPEPLLAEC